MSNIHPGAGDLVPSRSAVTGAFWVPQWPIAVLSEVGGRTSSRPTPPLGSKPRVPVAHSPGEWRRSHWWRSSSSLDPIQRFTPTLDRRTPGEVLAPGHHVHAERQSDLGHPGADLAEADQPQDGDLKGPPPALRSAASAGTQGGGLGDQIAGQSEYQRPGWFHRRRRRASPCRTRSPVARGPPRSRSPRCAFPVRPATSLPADVAGANQRLR